MQNYIKYGHEIHSEWGEREEFVTRRAQRLLKNSGITRPPFLPERLAPFQGIKRIIKEDLGSLSGLLLPLRDGFEIKINATHSPQRQNFSCAHEISHTFFFEEEGKTLIKALTKEKGGRISNIWLESLCDVSASELLAPSKVFIGYASRYFFGIHSIKPLCKIFNTSVIPIILRLCDLNPRLCSVIYWSRKNSGEIDDLKLRANWLTWTRMRLSSASRFLFSPKLYGDFSSVLKAYMSDDITFSHEWIGIGNFRGYSHISSQGFGTGLDRFVLSLVFPECAN